MPCSSHYVSQAQTAVHVADRSVTYSLHGELNHGSYRPLSVPVFRCRFAVTIYDVLNRQALPWVGALMEDSEYEPGTASRLEVSSPPHLAIIHVTSMLILSGCLQSTQLS